VTSVVFYFQVHQPFRLRRFSFFDIGSRGDYFDDTENARILRRVADKCYLPMNGLLREKIEEHGGELKLSMAITGTLLDQLERWSPEALDSFVALTQTGCVEIVCETSHHSLCFLEDADEFAEQVQQQRERIRALFGQDPLTFRCTELVCDNAIAAAVEGMGFRGMLGEGADHLLGWRSPHKVYRPAGCDSLKLLLRAYELSDDIAFRFSNRSWDRWPMTADDFADRLTEVDGDADFIGLFMDYETFGEHQWRQTGIFEFMEHLPRAVLERGGLDFATPAEVIEAFEPEEALDIPHPVSWADTERDLTAWLGNHMQKAANRALYDLAEAVKERAAAGDEAVLDDWRRLTTSDHVYYMCTKWFSDGDVHKYFSPYTTPHDAFIAFMNVLADVELRVRPGAGSRASLPPARPSAAPPRGGTAADERTDVRRGAGTQPGPPASAGEQDETSGGGVSTPRISKQ